MNLMEEIQVLLSERTYLYNLFQNIFGNAPSIPQMDIVTDEEVFMTLALFLPEEDKENAAIMEDWKQFCTAYQDKKIRILEKINNEYTNLFIGPGKLPAHPWESVYVTKEPLLFQESTLEVRKCYVKHNFLPAEYPHVADDHISLELDFMARVASRAEILFEKGNREEVIHLLKDQKQFLNEHLLIWIPEFSRKIQSSKSHYFYPMAAVLLVKALEVDLNGIEEILTVLMEGAYANERTVTV